MKGRGYFTDFAGINKIGAARAAVIFICLPFETSCNTTWDSINTYAVFYFLIIATLFMTN